jgi:hypothetical protein
MIAPPKPPAHDEPEALIKEARERQLRRRLQGAAGVAILAAFGLGVSALVPGNSVRGVTPANVSRTTGTRCRASQLSASFAFQGATQTMLGGATLENRSGSTCSLPTGWPTFRIVWHGKSIAIPVRRGSAAAPPWRRVRVLAPGRRALVVMQWWGLPVVGGGVPPRRLTRACRRVTGANFRPRVALQYDGGPRLSARATGLILPACGPLHSSWIAVSRPLVEH